MKFNINVNGKKKELDILEAAIKKGAIDVRYIYEGEEKKGHVCFRMDKKYPLLNEYGTFEELDLNNQQLVDYIWEKSGMDRYHCLYGYTTEYRCNWED